MLYEDAGGDKSALIGYCFYHLLDEEEVKEGGPKLYLAYGSFPTAEEEHIEIGQIIREEFEVAGFTVEWDGAADSRLLLKGFRW